MSNTVRQRAIDAGDSTYVAWGACPKCSSHLRHPITNKCAVCPPSLTSVRRAARDAGARTYQGPVCRTCGGASRLVSNKACAVCSVDLGTPSARQLARDAGETFYQGAPCAHGHGGKRYVSKGQCYDCQMHTSATRDPEVTRESRKLWSAANRHTRRTNARGYKAIRRQRKIDTDDGSITSSTLAALMERQNGRCAYCCDPVEHLDHKTPLARGGTHTLDNVQWTCAPCNVAKGTLTDDEYRGKFGVL